jgi:hypothetical protein
LRVEEDVVYEKPDFGYPSELRTVKRLDEAGWSYVCWQLTVDEQAPSYSQTTSETSNAAHG